MKCKNDPKKSYKGTEPSPKGLGYCAHAEKIGVIKQGKDKKQWIVKQTKNGSKRWVKQTTKTATAKKTSEPKNQYKTDANDCSNFVRYKIKVTPNRFIMLSGLKTRTGFLRKFIDTNKFEDKETKIPKNAKKVVTSKDIITEYFCNNKKQLQKDNEFYKNIKKLHNRAKSYFIHDNGGRPFLVYVQSNNEVFIYKKDETYQIDETELSRDPKNNRWIYTKLVKNYKPLKTFIGKSPLNEMTKFSGGYGAKFTGNTILLQISKDKYVHIGAEIKEYTIKEQIVKYVSPVGNNDVPYSYGTDKNNVYYLFGENVSIKDVPKEYKNDPYEYYYKVYLITPDEAYRPSKEPIIKNFDNITNFYIGSQKYTLTYNSDPKKEYKRYVSVWKKKPAVKKTDGKKYVLSESEYVKLMTKFGKVLCIKPIKIKLIEKRQ